MIKAALLVLFVVAASAWDFDLSPYDKFNPTHEQLQGLFNKYVKISPHFVQSTPERFEYFSSQVLNILEHNRNPAKTWTRKVNRFTGMTAAELKGYAIMDTQNCESSTASFEVSFNRMFDYPTSFDWRDQNMVTPVKNAGDCAASWAFAASSAIESHWAIASNSTPFQLSEQQLLDCSSAFGNQGCDSGLPSQAFVYVQQNGGINTENTYSYMMQAEGCVYNSSVVGAQVAYGSQNISAGDEAGIIQALVNYGPVAAVIDATPDFLSYNGGVYVGNSCGQAAQNVNHAVLIVGYGTDSASGLDFWTCQNSWGDSWGEAGYFRIQRGTNMCGIADCASFPAVTQVSEEISF